MYDPTRFLDEHRLLTRRYFFQLGAGAALVAGLAPSRLFAAGPFANRAEKLERFEHYLTPQEKFGDVSRGTPLPHALDDDKKREVGMTRDTWRLEILSDPEHPVRLRNAHGPWRPARRLTSRR